MQMCIVCAPRAQQMNITGLWLCRLTGDDDDDGRLYTFYYMFRWQRRIGNIFARMIQLFYKAQRRRIIHLPVIRMLFYVCLCVASSHICATYSRHTFVYYIVLAIRCVYAICLPDAANIDCVLIVFNCYLHVLRCYHNKCTYVIFKCLRARLDLHRLYVVKFY